MFNKKSKIKNILLSSSFGLAEELLKYLFIFAYRTVFLMILSKNYLGISGLFTNILQIFSLADLGIGSVIAYRLYEPIKRNDTKECYALIEFYKNVYRIIALTVLLLGLILSPFVNNLIADQSEIPGDVNLKTVYWLYVFQSVSSYLFVYVQSLLSSDQKNYVISFANTIYNLFYYIIQIAVLLVTHSFIYSLAAGIIANLIYNISFSSFIKKQYRYVFSEKCELKKSEKIQIFKDTGALMCHKLGYVALNSTDSLLLSKYIGIITLGIYSNYSMISAAIDRLLNKLLGSFISTIGNIGLDKNNSNYDIYNKLLFLNFWLVSFCCICYFNLIDSFIILWQNSSYTLDILTVTVITVNMFFNSSGIINSVFINANGLFVKDRVRPFIQAILNLIISIIMVKKIGISGVFFGTVISIVCTSWWRQPILVYKYIFKKNPAEYFARFFIWFFEAVVISLLISFIFSSIQNSLLSFIMKVIICAILPNIIFAVLNIKNDNFIFYVKTIIQFMNNRKKCKK